MKCYTVKDGAISPGIATLDGKIHVGEQGRGRELVTVKLPEGSTVQPVSGGPRFETTGNMPAFRGCISHGVSEWDGRPTAAEEETIKAAGATWRPLPDAPVVGLCTAVRSVHHLPTAALILVEDQSGFRGTWSMQKPEGLTVIAKGSCAQGDAGRMGGGPAYLLVLKAGGSFLISRSGRLYGKPAQVLILNNLGETSAQDIKEVELSREANQNLELAL